MLKHNLITVEYRPKANRFYRFRFNLWRNGKIVKSRCSQYWEGDCTIHHILGLKQNSCDVFYPFSANIAELIRRMEAYRRSAIRGVNEEQEKRNFIGYLVYNCVLQEIVSLIQAKLDTYRVSEAKIQADIAEDPNADPNFEIHCKMDLFELYFRVRQWQTSLYPDKREDITRKIMYEQTALWEIIKYIHCTEEFDYCKCLNILPKKEELEKEAEEVTKAFPESWKTKANKVGSVEG